MDYFQLQVAINFEEFEEEKDWRRGECVGRGGHSLCYVIKSLHGGRMMVVKQMRHTDPGAASIEEQKKEFELIKKLNHPNIIEVFGCNWNDSCFNIFQEWMPGWK